MAPKIEKATRRDFPEGIRAFGTDALRFTFCALATTGRDIVFDMGRVEGYRNFCNKLWNAARFVLMNTEGHDTGLGANDIELSLAERWIISRLQTVKQDVNDAIRGYRFDHAAQALYDFTWNEYCDWYLELVKPVLSNPQSSEASRRGARRTLVRVLEALLRLVHPLMPFISEEIWQRVAPLAGKNGATIMNQAYPVPDAAKIDESAVAEMRWLQQFVLGVRRIRAEMNIAPGKPLPVLLANGDHEDQARLARNHDFVSTLARLESITWLGPEEAAPEAATALVGGMKILIPLAGLIDKQAEIERLSREIDKLRQDLARSETKLNNANFVNRAPAAVVNKERARVTELGAAVAELERQLAGMRRL